jgi:hypothetical protein
VSNSDFRYPLEIEKWGGSLYPVHTLALLIIHDPNCLAVSTDVLSSTSQSLKLERWKQGGNGFSIERDHCLNPTWRYLSIQVIAKTVLLDSLSASLPQESPKLYHLLNARQAHLPSSPLSGTQRHFPVVSDSSFLTLASRSHTS